MDLRPHPSPRDQAHFQAITSKARAGTSLKEIVFANLERTAARDGVVAQLKERYWEAFNYGPQREAKRMALLDDALQRRGWNLNPHALAVDLGTGSGPALPHLAERQPRVLGIDLSLAQLAYASLRLAEEGVDRERVALVAADALALPLLDSAAGFVAASNVIEHVSDARQFIAEAARVLQEAAILFFSSPNRFSVWPEEHVGLRFVGFLPRALQDRYVRVRGCRATGFGTISLLSRRELMACLRGNVTDHAVVGSEERFRAWRVRTATRKVGLFLMLTRTPGVRNLLAALLGMFDNSFEIVARK